METVNPALEAVGSPLKPVDDTPTPEHTTPPDLAKEAMKDGHLRGYARKSRAKFSTASISMGGLGNGSAAVATAVEQNHEGNIDDDMKIMLDMDSEDEEDLDKYLTNIHTSNVTISINSAEANPANSRSPISHKPTSVSSVSSPLSDAKVCTQQPRVKEISLASMGNTVDPNIDQGTSNETQRNITINEKEQVEKLFDSSSDEDIVVDNSNSSSAPSSSDEEESGNVSDAAEDLPASVTGLKKKRKNANKLSKRAKKMPKQQPFADQIEAHHGENDNEQDADPRKPNKMLPFNGLIDEKSFREILRVAKESPGEGLSKRKIDKREKRNLPITSYLVVGKKKGYLPFCDGKCILNEELISNIRKELHKLMKLSPKLRSQSNLLQPAPLVPLMMDRANRLFEILWPGMPGVEFRGGVEGVRFTVANINLAIKVLNPDLQLDEKKKSVASSRLANALNNASLNQLKPNAINKERKGSFEDEEDVELQSKTLMIGLVEKLRQRKLSRQSSSKSKFTSEVLKAKERGAMEVHRIAKQNSNLIDLGVFGSIGQENSQDQLTASDTYKVKENGISSSQDENTELIRVENMKGKKSALPTKERRRSLSAPTMGNMSSQIPTLGSYVSNEDVSCDSSSDSDIELVGNPNITLKKHAIESSADRIRVKNAKKRKASTRIPSFRRFIRTKGGGTPKGPVDLKRKGVVDGQNVRKHYFKTLRQVKENKRLTEHAKLQGYNSFDQWKEAERKEAAKKGMDEAQVALSEAIQQKVFGDKVVQNTEETDHEKDKSGLSSSVKNIQVVSTKEQKSKDKYAKDKYIRCTSFIGAKEGYVFKMDHLGLGYYLEDSQLNQNVESSTLGISNSEVEKQSSIVAGKHVEGAPEDSKASQESLDNTAPDSMLTSEAPHDDPQTDAQNLTRNNYAIESTEASSDNDEYNATKAVAAKNANRIEDATEEETNKKHVDRAAAFREQLIREAENLKKKRGVASFVEEEASESEDEENMGVGEYGVEDMMKRKQDDLLDEKLDKMTKSDVLKADLEGIVDAPSDDEGDQNADEEGFHAQKMQEDDDIQVAAVVKNIQEGWARERRGRRRGRDLDLVEGNKRQKGRLGLDVSDDENDNIDEEAALAARVERERVRHGSFDFDDVMSSSDDEDMAEPDEELGPNGEVIKKLKPKPESQTHEFEREHESVEVKRLRRLAKEHRVRAIHSKLQKAGVVSAVSEHGRVTKTTRENTTFDTTGSSSFVFGRRSSLLVNMDDGSSQILGMLKRTNTGRRTATHDGENIMKSGSIVTGSTANDTASLTVNSGSHTARAVHGMLNKTRHGTDDDQDVNSGNGNVEAAADVKSSSSFSKSNPIFSLGSNNENPAIQLPQQPERQKSRLRRSFSNVSYNQGSFLNTNSSRQAYASSNQGTCGTTAGPTSFGMFNGGNAISRKFVFRRDTSSSIHDSTSRSAWNEDILQPRRTPSAGSAATKRDGASTASFAGMGDTIFMTHESKNENSNSALLWDALASNNFMQKGKR